MSSLDKNLDCFVIGIMDIKDTSKVMTDGKEVFIKANSLSNMKYAADIEMLKDSINIYFKDFEYSDLHFFCTEFLLAEAQGLMSEKIFKRIKR